MEQSQANCAKQQAEDRKELEETKEQLADLDDAYRELALRHAELQAVCELTRR